jgi:hypothetical protein
VLQDRAVVPVNAEAKLIYALSRLAPNASGFLERLDARRLRRETRK